MITLTGDNDFGRQQALETLIADFEAEHGALAIERLEGSDTTRAAIEAALQSIPFLASRKLVVLKEPSKLVEFSDHAEHILADVPESTDVIIVEPKLDKRKVYYKVLQKQTDFQNFAALDEQGLAKWLVERAHHAQATISMADARYLIERVGANQLLLANELDKLTLYDPKITRQTIELLTEASPQSSVFQLIEAAVMGKPAAALKLYAEQRAQKVEPAQIIALLTWQLHTLAVLKAAQQQAPDDIAKQAGLNPFVVRKNQSIAQRLSLQQLTELANELLQIDVALKRSYLDADEALQGYLLHLARSTSS